MPPLGYSAPPICAPPGHAPPEPRAPGAHTRRGALPRGHAVAFRPCAEPAGEAGLPRDRPFACWPGTRTRGRGGGSARPPVRVLAWRATPWERGGFRAAARSRVGLAREPAGEGAARSRVALAREPAGKGGLPRGRPFAFCPGANLRERGGGLLRGRPFACCPAREPAGEGGASTRLPVRVLPWRANLREGGGFRAVARSRFAWRANRGKGGGGASGAPLLCVPVRTLPVRANPGRGGRTPTWSPRPRSRTARACKRGRGKGCGGAPVLIPARGPLVCGWPLRANRGGHHAASGVARTVPGKRGKGGCARLVPRRPASRVLFACKGGGGRAETRDVPVPYTSFLCPPPLARKRERRLQWRGLSRVRESTGVGAVFGSPVRRERGRGQKGGRTCPAPPLRA
ncbi:hypothetical protein EDB89DRAFT_1912786 [Lactarius sanguifluus]|nr:hypothetical protein EDB89DRAFT_1912786 [Lactarius sanguifluus]